MHLFEVNHSTQECKFGFKKLETFVLWGWWQSIFRYLETCRRNIRALKIVGKRTDIFAANAALLSPSYVAWPMTLKI